MTAATDAARAVVGKFSKQDVISLLAVVAAILILGVYVGRTSAGLELKIEYKFKAVEKEIKALSDALTEFKAPGLRCPAERCSAIERRVTAVEEEHKEFHRRHDSLNGQVSRNTARIEALNGGRPHASPNDWMLPGIVK